MVVKIYTVRSGEKLGDAASIIGADPNKEVRVNIVAFQIEGGVMEPAELKELDEQLRHIGNKLDPSKPTIVTGRGPLWLYALLAHNLHFLPSVATWEPRAGVGVIYSATDRRITGRGVTLDGNIVDVSIPGASSDINDIVIKTARVGDKNLVHVELKQRFINPHLLKDLEARLPPIADQSKILVIEGLMPVWLASYLVDEYVHKSTAAAIYDPRLNGAVVFATHRKDVSVGSVIQITQDEISAVLKEKKEEKEKITA